MINVSPNMRDLSEELSTNASTSWVSASAVYVAVPVHKTSGWRQKISTLVVSLCIKAFSSSISKPPLMCLNSGSWKDLVVHLPQIGVAVNRALGTGACCQLDSGGDCLNFHLEMDEVEFSILQALSMFVDPTAYRCEYCTARIFNTHDTAKNLHPRVTGRGLAPSDQPWITGTQWDSVAITSQAGWSGLHEWFDSTPTLASISSTVELRGLYYAAGTLWDANRNMVGNLTTLVLLIHVRGRGAHARSVGLDCHQQAYFLAVRTYVTTGAGMEITVVQDRTGSIHAWKWATCGPYGTCEAVENPPGHFRPTCVCIMRWQGERCEIEAAAPLVLVVSGTTSINGSTSRGAVTDSLVSAVPGV